MIKKNHIILMADIIESRVHEQAVLIRNFDQATRYINHHHQERLDSPLTITLGDEFQGIVRSAAAAMQLIFDLEEHIIRENYGFKLRYVLVEGRIDTAINHERAYGMLGQGLTDAREALTDLKASNSRFYVELQNRDASKALINTLLVYQSIVDNWKVETDFQLIANFMIFKDYKEVARQLDKTRSQIWKREKSLQISEYFALKEVAAYISSTA